MKQLLEQHKLILMEAAVVEQLRRSVDVDLHPHLVIAPLIYEESGRTALRAIYQGYIDIAREAKMPLLVCTPTWRADHSRVIESGASKSINVDAAHFMSQLRESPKNAAVNIKIGGMIGCSNDSYRPEEGLPAAAAERFHSWQIDQLVQGGVDFLIAETLPSVEEATGIAKAMEKAGLPYIISFVISRDGRVWDGTDLNAAIELIDAKTDRQPLGFMVNCAYPSFLQAAKQPEELFNRLIGYQANASSLDHSALDGAETLRTESVSDWGDQMLELNESYGVHILGGCCGTGPEHLRYLARLEGERATRCPAEPD
jgi:homocysteine S-methyltransferase